MAVVLDIINGAGGRKTRRGIEYDRIAKVTALVSVSGHARFAEAIAALAAATPESVDIGDEHPTSEGTFCEEIAFQHDSTDILELRLVYRLPEAIDGDGAIEDRIIEVGTSLEQASVNTDSTGTAVSVTHNGQVQGVMMSVLRPQTTAIIVTNHADTPFATAQDFVGKVNDGGWVVDPAAPVRTWLCTSIIGRSRNNGASFTVTREYAYNPDTWDQLVVWIDKETGRPPPDLTVAGRKIIQVYEDVDMDGSLI